jgi:hypothetical protein
MICPSTENRQMGKAMADEQAVAPAPVDGPVSIARLHGLACFYCGSVTRTMYADGHIILVGNDTVWPIVTCGCRRRSA